MGNPGLSAQLAGQASADPVPLSQGGPTPPTPPHPPRPPYPISPPLPRQPHWSRGFESG